MPAGHFRFLKIVVADQQASDLVASDPASYAYLALQQTGKDGSIWCGKIWQAKAE